MKRKRAGKNTERHKNGPKTNEKEAEEEKEEDEEDEEKEEGENQDNSFQPGAESVSPSSTEPFTKHYEKTIIEAQLQVGHTTRSVIKTPQAHRKLAPETKTPLLDHLCTAPPLPPLRCKGITLRDDKKSLPAHSQEGSPVDRYTRSVLSISSGRSGYSYEKAIFQTVKVEKM